MAEADRGRLPGFLNFNVLVGGPGSLALSFGGGGLRVVDAFDPIRGLDELPASHANRVRFLPVADRSVIGTIRFGVLFVMTWWSGPSRQGFARLKQVLAALDPGGRLKVVVVDTDGCPDLFEAPEFAGQLQRWGEVGWVRDGRVVRTSGKGYHPECFEPFTRELLASAQTPNQALQQTGAAVSVLAGHCR